MLPRTVDNLANIYFASSHVWKQILSQVFQNLIPADTLAFVVKMAVYKEKCSQTCKREASFLSAQSVERRHRSKHWDTVHHTNKLPFQHLCADVGEVTHGNTNHCNTACCGSFPWENETIMLSVYFAVSNYLLLLDCSELSQRPKHSSRSANSEASAIAKWSPTCPWSLGLEPWEETDWQKTRGGDSGAESQWWRHGKDGEA